MISIIIPTLNEEDTLPLTIERIRQNPTSHEIIVVDGGSRDSTPAIASAAGAKILCSALPNRAGQMNLGARHATGDIFLFLHADTHLRETSLAQIENISRDQCILGGGFARRFDCNSFFLRFTCGLATLRCSLCGWFLGDQGIFVRPKVFEKLGGFREMKMFEDLNFSRRMRRLGKTVTLRPGVISSARRFRRQGAFTRTALDFILTCKHLSGR